MHGKLRAVLTDESKRARLQYICVFGLFVVVAAFMTVLNIVTRKGALTAATGAFAALCALNLFLVLRCGRIGMTVSSFLFMAEIIALFVFFILSGSPEGFSVIWIALLPTCGMILFGRKRTLILCAVMLAVLVFFFWLPAGRAMLPEGAYTRTFLMRFPILYVAFFLLSAILETIRAITQEELNHLRKQYQYRSAHDYLTDLLNRRGLKEWYATFRDLGEQGAYMIDIDHFKKVNDSFGHDIGDMVLAGVAKKIAEHVDSRVCRWGGEEFVVWFPDSGRMGDPEIIREEVEKMVFEIPYTDKTVSVTVSIGAARGRGELETVVRAADAAMFRAKEKGRNRVEYAE